MSNPFNPGRPTVWCEQDGLKNVPRVAGAYRFVQKDNGTIDYIGITSNLYTRMSNHRSDKKKYDPTIHRVAYQVAESDHTWSQLCAWEAMKIGVHRPPLNKTRGGNGKVAKVYIPALRSELAVARDESIEDAAERKGLLSRLIDLFRR
jgi:diketogulonate reductase-like aldo/keto reductase